MNRVFRILCLVFAILLVIICLNLVIAISEIIINYNESLSYHSPENQVFIDKYTTKIILERVVYFVICSSASVLLFVCCFKGSNLLNFTRLTYEEYKEAREKKKAEKQAKKKQKLEEQLKRLED